MSADRRVGVVIVTKDRPDDLRRALGELRRLPERPEVVVVDNGSASPLRDAVRAAHPDAALLEAGDNLGAAGRTLGVRRLDSPYVAFCDDDSWWAPGSLGLAADLLDAHPTLGLLAARVLVGPDERLDPVSTVMRESRIPGRPGVGPGVLGFVACGAVVRREAYLAVGGFHRCYGIGGEEALLAIDLAEAGWDLCYCDAVVAHHHPATGARDPRGRLRRQRRNDLWTLALRHDPRRIALAAAAAARDPIGRRALWDAVRGLPWVARERRRVSPVVEHRLRLIDQS